ncbi:Hypothetical predicted protein [Paramuricea clavata]|uniref:Uncharacterized protein n=1 Tax=Paramuricea clavata TaxID=317549 RepID=A0A6S7LER8_PARCT|nr:Hypothetical predicted protein [Paramuricea clavata]
MQTTPHSFNILNHRNKCAEEMNETIESLNEYSTNSNNNNSTKTEWMMLSTMQMSTVHSLEEHSANIICREEPLEKLSSTRLLGVQLDQNLSWREHMNLLSSCYVTLSVLKAEKFCAVSYSLSTKAFTEGAEHVRRLRTVEKSKQHPNDKPWITSELRSLIQQRQQAMDKDPETFRKLRNKVNRLNNRLRSSFFERKVKNCDDAVNSELDYETAEEIALKYWISPEDVYKQLSNLKRGKASEPDNLPTWILKDFAMELSSPVALIFNAFIQERTVPNAWKVADIISIPKINPVKDIEKDLRPISLTAVFSKTMERFCC